MKLEKCYHLEYSGYCLHLYYYIHYVSTDASFDLLEVLYVKLRSLHRTSNQTLYLIHGNSLF